MRCNDHQKHRQGASGTNNEIRLSRYRTEAEGTPRTVCISLVEEATFLRRPPTPQQKGPVLIRQLTPDIIPPSSFFLSLS